MKVSSLLIALSLFAVLACAQNVSGPPAKVWGTYQRNLSDSVDLAHIQVGFSVPVVHKAERGMPMDLTLGFGSVAWTRANNAWTPSGVSDGMAIDGPLVGQFTSAIYLYECNDYYGGTYYFNVATNFDFVDPQGHDVAFSAGDVTVEDPYPSECDPSEDPGYPQGQTTAWAVDGTGWTIVANSDGSATLTSMTGVTYSGYSATNPASNAVHMIDRNGNKMSEVQNWDYIADNSGDRAFTFSGSPQSGTLDYGYTAQGDVYSHVTIAYSAFTLQTAFGCPGITEYSGTAHLPVKVTMPDGSYYAIQYEQTPGYGAGYTTGRITSLQIPAGGTITYEYPSTEPNDDTNCGTTDNTHDGAGRTLVLKRTTPDGTTTYSASTQATQVYTTLQLTTITDPAGNTTVDTFAPDGYYDLVKRQIYTGAIAAGTLVSTEDLCYTQPLSRCNYWFNQGIAWVYRRLTVPNGAGVLMRDTKTYYDDPGPSELDESAWYASGSPVWARKTFWNYNYLGNNPELFLTSKQVEDGSGTVVAETDYAYDQTQPQPSGAPMHQTGINFGNVTTITSRVNGSTTLTKQIQYYDTGEPYKVTDVNGLQTLFDYTCSGELPYHVWRAGQSGYDQTWSYDCQLEAPLQFTDVNGVNTYWQRGKAGYALPTQITHPDGSVTNITYTSGGPGVAATTDAKTAFNGATVEDYTVFDSLGRAAITQHWNGANWDTVATSYDADGRPFKVSAPFAASKGSGGGSAFTTTSFDGAGRPVEVDGPTGGWTKYTYTANDVYIERGPIPQGSSENTKRRQLEYDALGRLTSVCEITAGTPSWPGGACGQSVGQTGYWTTYGYNLLDKITTVTQNAQAAAVNQQTRSFAFDELGRLTQQTTPEAGTTAFWYGTSDGSCTAYTGDLVERKDNAGNVTCYAYDIRRRLTAVTYPSGPNAGNTPSKHFIYDAAADGSITLNKTVGRLAEAYTQTAAGVQVDEAFSYTGSGQVADYYQSSPNSGGYYHSSETYYANGAPYALSVPGMPVITYGLDGAGRVHTVSAASGQNPVTSTAYSPLGLTGVTFGSGDGDTYGYDPAGEMTGYTFTVNGQTDTGTLNWNKDGSLGSLAVADNVAGANDSQFCNYSEDDLGRLTAAGCGTVGQAFSYDPFGNMRTDATAGTYSFSADFNLFNRIASVGGFSPAYDNDGNLTQDPGTGTANTYNADGQPVDFEGAAVVYDALGRAVEAGGYELEYAPGGARMTLMTGPTTLTGFVPLPGGGTAVYSGGQLAFYQHADWEGSARLMSTPSRGLYGTAEYTPFGSDYDAASDVSFTGQPKIYGGDQYNFPMRNLSPIQGRWWTPDPGGLAAVTPEDPQTWNAYAYVRGNPLEATDPTGLLTTCVNWWGCGSLSDFLSDDPFLWPNNPNRSADLGSGPHMVKGINAARRLTSIPNANCAKGMKESGADLAGLNRAIGAWNALSTAASANGVDAAMLGAIALRETDFRDVNEVDGKGVGVGVFQITVAKGDAIGQENANNLAWAANYAAKMLHANEISLSKRFPRFDPAQLAQATAASYNLGPYGISGNPATIDVGSPGNNYGASVLLMMDCFLVR